MPWGKMIADFAYAEKSQGDATVLGRRESIAAARAALCNGTAMHGIELDDVETGGQVHPGSVVIPAALAAAEHCGASGERLLLGIVAGYEAISRVGKAITEVALSFHMTGVAGPVGAAVAAGVSMNLPSEQILRAIGVACSCSAGIKSFTQGSGGMIKRMHAGRAAEAGVVACLLAERGFTAPLAAIDGRFGLLEAFGGDNAHPERLVENLGPGIHRKQDMDQGLSVLWVYTHGCPGIGIIARQAQSATRGDRENTHRYAAAGGHPEWSHFAKKKPWRPNTACRSLLLSRWQPIPRIRCRSKAVHSMIRRYVIWRTASNCMPTPKSKLCFHISRPRLKSI